MDVELTAVPLGGANAGLLAAIIDDLRLDFLDEPHVAVGIAERREGAVVGAVGVQSRV